MINALHVAQSGLTAARTSVENVMNNIANENTAGYKKRVVELGEAAHIDGRVTGRGVFVGDTVRITSMFMYDNLLKENSKEAYYDELSTKLADVESLFYETEDSGFSNDLNRYFQAMEDLRSDPNNEIYKNNLSNQANIIVEDLQNLYKGIEDIEKSATIALSDDVELINGILTDIGKINEQLGQQLVASNDLLDRRDALENELSQYVDISIDRTEDYELKIGGVIAVRYNTNIHNLSVVDNPTAQKDIFDQSDFAISAGDSVTYRLNNSKEFTVTEGDFVDGVSGTTVTDSKSMMDAIAYRINNTSEMSASATATVVSHTDTLGAISYTLDIESATKGESGKFESVMLFNDTSSTTTAVIDKNENSSIKATNDVHVEIFDEKLPLKSGTIKAVTENLTTESGNNKFTEYKAKLDAFVQTFVDVHDAFVTQTDGTYLYGEKAADLDNNGVTTAIGMFSGSTVNTLKFNESSISSFTQEKIDYLASLQWKDDLGFDGNAQDGSSSSGTSFQKYYQTLQVQIASDKENTDYLQETQSAITNSLQGTYDQLVKVDKDEELINLIKFQSSYEANAKIITVVDEMLATILGMKR